MSSTPTGWETAAIGSSVGYRSRLPPLRLPAGWPGRPWPLPLPLPLPLWQLALALALLIGLLAAFHGVVSAGVTRAETRHQATRTHGEALWRCKSMPGRNLRNDCLRQLDVEPDLVTATK